MLGKLAPWNPQSVSTRKIKHFDLMPVEGFLLWHRRLWLPARLDEHPLQCLRIIGARLFGVSLTWESMEALAKPCEKRSIQSTPVNRDQDY